MNKKIFMLLFFLLVLMSMPAVSAENLDDNNDTVVLSDDTEMLSAANDVDAIRDLNGNDAAGGDKALQNDAQTVAAGEDNEIYSEGYEEAEGDLMSPVLGEGAYNIYLNFNEYYNPKTTVTGHVERYDQIPFFEGNLEIWVDGQKKVDDLVQNEEYFRYEIGSLDAGKHTWNAKFTDFGWEEGTGKGDFTIKPANTRIDISQSSIEMYVDETIPAGAKLNPSQAGELSYSSSDENVAYVTKDENGTYINADCPGTATITVSFAGNKNYNTAQNKTINVTVKPYPPIYVNATADQGGNGSEAAPFQTLKEALDNVKNYGTIMIASGTYTGENNTNLTINKNLNFVSYGAGEVIFDAQSLSRIWTVNAGRINITGLTFKNGKDQSGCGAILFNQTLNNSSINAIFINNSVVDGAACAIGFYADVTNTNINSIFINNSANNGSGSVIYIIHGDETSIIHDSIFINNKIDDKLIDVITGSVSSVNNWFGNNATNYNIKPKVSTNVTMANWLFLNATTNTTANMKINETGEITFKLYSYDGVSQEIKEYDASKMNIKLDLTPIHGTLNQTSAFINETILFKCMEEGFASITGKFETASYTIILANRPTEIIINKSEITLKVNESVSAGATLNPTEAGNLTYTSSNTNVAVVENGIIKGLKGGTAIITVSFAGNERYAPAASKNITVHVEKITPIIIVSADVADNNVSIHVDIDRYDGLISMDLFDSLVYFPINSSLTFVQTLNPGSYNVNITALGNDFFYPGSEILNFTVPEAEKLNTSITAQPSVNGNTVKITVGVDLNATGLVEIAVAGNKYYVQVDAGKAVFTNDYPAGIYSADITYLGDNNYNPANTTAQFSVIGQNETRENTSIKINVVTGANYAMFTVDVNESATGLVEINIAGEAVYLAVNNGQVTYEAVMPSGDYTVTATYLGDDRFNGNSTSSEFTVKDHEKINTTITTSVSVINSTATLTVNVNESATGFVEISIAGKKYYVPVDAGKAVFSNDYSTGTYSADITYLGDDNFNPSKTSTSFTIIEHNATKKDTPIDINVACVDNNVTITINVDPNATGLVEINIDGEAAYLPINNGEVMGEFYVTAGNHKVTATYLGDSKFNANTTSTEFTVKNHEKINTPIESQAIIDGNTVTLTANVNENATGFIEVIIAGKNYYLPVENGKAVLVNDYLAGTYVADITYLGDDNFNPAKTFTSFTVIDHNETKKDTPININVACVDNNVTITVNVDPNATGLVEINIDGEAVYLPVNNGEVISEYLMDAGSHKVTATYLGDSKFNSNMTSAEFTVKNHEKVNTTIKSQTTVDGNTVTLTVTVNDGATGFVEVSVADKKYYVPVENGKAVLVNDYLAGTYVADITYLGDDNFNPAKTSASFTVIEHNATKKDTPINIDVVCDENNVTITVNIASNATGLVEISIDGEAAYLPVNNGEVMGEFYVTAGNHKVTATYLGDNKFNSNATTAEFTVKGHEKVNTTIKSQATVDGNTVTLTANVNENATGFIEVCVAGNKYYVPVENGEAVLVNDYLAGTYIADINYLGDDNFNPAKDSVSFTVIEHNVTKIDTPIDIGVAIVGNYVNITVNVDDNATGLIEINIGDEVVYLPVNNGAVIGEFLLDKGNYNVTATYLGDNKFNGNTTSAEFTVKGHEKVNTTIKSQATVDGNTVTLTATINNAATGFVEVSVAGKKYYIPIENGNAVLINDYLAGTYVAEITYLGDDNFNTAKTSASFTVIEHNETKKDTPINIDVFCVDNNVNITVTVDADATGLVEISADGEAVYLPVNNGEVIGEFLMAAGNHKVTATYLGDSKFNANTTSTEFTVKGHEKINTTIKSQAAVDGNTVTLTVTVNSNATGFVEVSVAGKKYYVPVEKGNAVLVNDYLVGTYAADITYLGDDNFNPAKTSASFTVIEHKETKKDTPIDIGVAIVGNYANVTVSVDAKATGLVEIIINDEAVYLPVYNGMTIGEFILDEGDYNVTATYLGDYKFNGNTTSAEFTVEGHVKANTTISASAISIENTAIITVKVNENATGYVELTIGSTTVYVEVEDGVARYESELPEGNYSFTANYLGDDNFNENTTEGTFTVSGHLKRSSNIDASVSVDGDNVVIDISVPGATGYVTLDWGENLMYVPLENGSAVFEDEFESGSYEVNIVYSGDDYYLPSDKTVNFTTGKVSTKVTAGDVTMVYNGGKYLVATLKDGDGNAVSGAKVTIKLGDVTKTLTTDGNGQVSLSLNGILPNIYTATITFDGDDIYDKSSTTAKVTITKLQSKVYLRNALYFTLETKMVKVVLWDADNKPVAGKTVHITLNEYGLTYSGVTDENGVATIRIGVGFGVHSATVSFDGDEIYDASNRTGNVRVIKETPFIMVRGANTHFKASTTPKIVKVYLWDRNSKPLPANSKVAIKINGQTFIGYTDNQGIASVKINVNKPGIFNAEVRYAGNSAYNGVSKSVKFIIS